jgi:hypothetical protein
MLAHPQGAGRIFANLGAGARQNLQPPSILANEESHGVAEPRSLGFAGRESVRSIIGRDRIGQGRRFGFGEGRARARLDM